ncbi:REP element-mobilizing transposase RayT [Prosthecobacter fusiformis]|uniref:REP element-mobilizing transposase RayT n=1 Tax=Prosthecobacter fusiformis TaxID=48464 RepID=A0A4R7RZ08_9BACT|nr:transposase [Prosthecobacter fusiformis]TDU71184.1 REP element-mobilizing transposase RayT [Prosthecobacter fusiformis]
MARSLRIQYPGAYYHVMARGNRREVIFHDEDDRRFFLQALSEACERTGWRVHAWVLLGNHYHLFVQTPEANLVAGMAWLQNAYTRRYNVQHRAWGRVFGDRYKAVLVEGDDRYHYQTLMDYIHLNPVRAGLVRPKAGQSLLDYPWSSLAGGYALVPSRRAKWLAAEAGLKAFELDDTTRGRRRMVERLDRRGMSEAMKACGVPALPDEVDARCSHLRRGWYWGQQAFGEKLRELARKLVATRPPVSRGYKNQPAVRMHSLEQAQQWLKGGLKAAGLKPGDLERLKGSDPRKLMLAHLLWKKTTVTQQWIAENLAMKTAANVSQQLRRLDEKKTLEKLPARLQEFIKEK